MKITKKMRRPVSLNNLLSPEFLIGKVCQTALTHCSTPQNKLKTTSDNERLEWLGDAILDYLITAYLFNLFQEFKGEELSSMRSSLVCNATLSDLSKELGVGGWLVAGRAMNVASSPAVAANAFEALIGALWNSRGLSASWEFIARAFASRLDKDELLSVVNHSSREVTLTIKTSRLLNVGNKILKYLMSVYLFKKFPEVGEGELSKKRDQLTCRKTQLALVKNHEAIDLVEIERKEYQKYQKQDVCVLSIVAADVWQRAGLRDAWDLVCKVYDI